MVVLRSGSILLILMPMLSMVLVKCCGSSSSTASDDIVADAANVVAVFLDVIDALGDEAIFKCWQY